jgi:hypothetical protein
MENYDLNQTIKVESILAQPEFESTLEIALETCISDRQFYDDTLRALGERRANETPNPVARQCGVWSVRTNLEISFGNHPPLDHEDDEEDKEPSLDQAALTEGTETEATKEEPHYIMQEADPVIQDKIEAFGSALLAEAFTCLGADVEAKVQEFVAAKTHNDKIEIVNWLLMRVEEIVERDKTEAPAQTAAAEDNTDDEEEFDEAFYHPAFLSPKLLGKHPETRFRPSCLGISVLVASFFEKAGTPYLHAGIARTAADEARRAQSMAIRVLRDFAAESDADLPDRLAHRFNEAIAENKRRLNLNHGYHAGVLLEAEDLWLILDTNFATNDRLELPTGLKLGQIRAALLGMQPSARGIDCMIEDGAFLESYTPTLTLNELKDYALSLDDIMAWLREAPLDISADEIIDQFFSVYKLQPDTDKHLPAVDYLRFIIAKLHCVYNDEDVDDFIRFATKSALKEYVFPNVVDGDYRKVITRCQNDPSYLQNRAEDLKFVPLLLTLRLGSQLWNNVIHGRVRLAHSVYEVGLPAFRIGACVLSDFEVYCGDGTPTSLWLSNWASSVALTEHLPFLEGSPSQLEFGLAVADYLSENILHYAKNDEIISSFLEQGMKKKDEKES